MPSLFSRIHRQVAVVIMVRRSTDPEYHHDLESLLYVLVYISCSISGPEIRRPDDALFKFAKSNLEQWFANDRNMKQAGSNKHLHVTDETLFAENILCEVDPYFSSLRKCLEYLRCILNTPKFPDYVPYDVPIRKIRVDVQGDFPNLRNFSKKNTARKKDSHLVSAASTAVASTLLRPFVSGRNTRLCEISGSLLSRLRHMALRFVPFPTFLPLRDAFLLLAKAYHIHQNCCYHYGADNLSCEGPWIHFPAASGFFTPATRSWRH